MTSAEIITIGTEILLGEIVDTNTRYLVRNLRGLGVAQSPEGRLIDLSRMTVMENLEMGAYVRKDLTSFKDDLEHVFSLFRRLKERITQKGGTLSGGEQKMLAMARALMAKPKILLLDEPSMGLAPI